MADVSHELGSLRYLVESPLSSKVAMFNNQVNRHHESQSLNPFSQTDGRASPKPTFGKDDYGKPLAGSLTERRGQNANIHVLKEMLELCQIIDSEGYNVKDEPTMRVIPFGELFNIYTYISDKVVGILLRARKHKLVDFEGECLFQRRDDNVPVFLLKPIQEIRKILEEKQNEIRRSASPAPQATSILMDKQKQRSASPATPSTKTAKKPKETSEMAKHQKSETNKTSSSENLATKPPSGVTKSTDDNTKEALLVSESPSQPIETNDTIDNAVSILVTNSNTAERPQTPTIIINDENNVQIDKEEEEEEVVEKEEKVKSTLQDTVPTETVIIEENNTNEISKTVPTINIEAPITSTEEVESRISSATN